MEPLAEHYTVTAVVDGDPRPAHEAVDRFDWSRQPMPRTRSCWPTPA
ncbi:MAG: hypothetical protein R2851_12985 [Caldilineaceae bacterium]